MKEENIRCFNAWHEAGHAVAAIVCGFDVVGVDLVPQVVPGTAGLYGSAGIDLRLPDYSAVKLKGEENVIDILTVLYSGYMSEKTVNPKAILEYNHNDSDGCRIDFYSAVAIAGYRIENGIVKTSLTDRDILVISTLKEKAELRSEALVREHLKIISLVTEKLIQFGQMSGDEVLKIVSGNCK